MRWWITLALAAALTPGAMAQAVLGTMTVATFLSKADALAAKGPLAAFSSDLSLLKNEVTFAGQAYRQKIKAEASTGRPSSCPPARAPFTSDDVIAQMKTYAVGNRQYVTVATAVADLFRKRYPCRD